MSEEASTRLDGRLIAFFHQSSDMYGSDKILLFLAEGVLKHGGHAIVFLPDEGPLTIELRARGIEYHTLPVLKVSRARFSIKGLITLAIERRIALAAYDKALRGRHVDLVHSNTIAVLGGATWARRNRIPHLWHVHEIIEHPRIAARLFPLLLLRYADHVVCNSRATHDWLANSETKLKRKMSVIWNGIHAPGPVDADQVARLTRQFRPASTRFAVGLVGRINRWKGHQLLLDAADILHGHGRTDFAIVFVGSPPPGQEFFESQLRARIEASTMHTRISILPFSSDIWPVYQALDVVCVPSTEPEPFGLVAVEAMATGKPVVASNFGGLTEIVESGSTGRLFTPNDANALAKAIDEILSSDAMRAEYGRKGQMRFDTNFSVTTMQFNFAEVFATSMAEYAIKNQ